MTTRVTFFYTNPPRQNMSLTSLFRLLLLAVRCVLGHNARHHKHACLLNSWKMIAISQHGTVTPLLCFLWLYFKNAHRMPMNYLRQNSPPLWHTVPKVNLVLPKMFVRIRIWLEIQIFGLSYHLHLRIVDISKFARPSVFKYCQFWLILFHMWD